MDTEAPSRRTGSARASGQPILFLAGVMQLLDTLSTGERARLQEELQGALDRWRKEKGLLPHEEGEGETCTSGS